MASYLNLDDISSLKTKIEEKALHIFQSIAGKPQLQVRRHVKRNTEEAQDALYIVRDQDVAEASEIKALECESEDSSQFFIIRQERSWTTLNISRKLFEDLLDVYGVFSHFWKVIFTFGVKNEENEFTFPGFRARQSINFDTIETAFYESAYVLRRVERSHRTLIEGQSPWSIRQTAVYHKLSTISDSPNPSPGQSHAIVERPRSTFIFIAPSPNLERQLSCSLELSKSDERAIGPWNVHRLLIADSLSGWMDYMAWLEEALREQSNLIIFAKVGAEKDNLSPLTDFNINFIDRQTLKILEDSVIDLQIILPTLLSNIVGVREQCRKVCEKHHRNEANRCDCPQIIAELDEHTREAETHVKRAEALKKKANSTAKLLSDLLSYEDAISLKDVAKESQKESRSMFFLTVRSTKDAVAVKVLTIISLIYLPTIIVANFFSTVFVHTDDNGNMELARNSWLLAAIAVPLTIITIVTWWAWVRYANRSNPAAPQEHNVIKIVRHNSFRSLLSSRRSQRLSDIEGRTVSGVGTWSTVTTANKSQ